MINKVSIRHFKCLREVDTDLERFTILVGPNASGKSSMLQAVDLLCRLPSNPHGNVLGEMQQAVSRGATDDAWLAAELGGKAYRFRTRLTAQSGTAPRAGPAGQPGQPWDGFGWGVGANCASTDWRPLPFPQANQSPLPSAVFLELEGSKLRAATPLGPTASGMAADGSGLHAALANMALNEPDLWQELQASLRRIIPSIRRLRHTKTKQGQPAALLFDTVGGDSLLAADISEGTLLVLGLLAALYAPARPNLVLLDDLDRGLHPKAQKDLIALLRDLLDTHGNLQLLATTHSPYMLDCMETKEVRMTVLGDDGATVCAPLTSHPQFEKWKDEMTPGEMWSLFGEKWLLEQGATA